MPILYDKGHRGESMPRSGTSVMLWTVIMLLTSTSIFGWTEPITLSDQVNDVQWPRLCWSPSGGMHLIYRLRFKPWKVAYRFRDQAGNWTPIEYPGSFVFQ